MRKYKFKAKIEAGDGGGAYVCFPFDVQKEFATQNKVPVKAIFDGVAYTGSLIKCGSPQHMLPMVKAIRAQLGKHPGDTVEIILWKDEQERTVEIPSDFDQLLKKEGLSRLFEKLSYTHRKEYCSWIRDAKKQETRSKRLDKAAQMLRQGVKTPG